MPRPRTGQTRYRDGRWTARVTVGDQRPTFELSTITAKPDESGKHPLATARANLLADLAGKLVEAKQTDLATAILTKAASRDGDALQEVVTLVDRLCAGKLVRIAAGDSFTMQKLGEMWTSGELHKLHPDHVKQKRSADTDEYRLKRYIYPAVGDRPVAAFTLDDAERVMAMLPREGRGSEPGSRRQVAQLMGRLLKLAVYPLRLRDSSPIPPGWLPKLGPPKAKAFVYPDEDAKLMGAVNVPLCYRILYGALHREGMRAGEALALQWRDVDLERGFVSLDENKTDDPRGWNLDAGVLAVLRWWRAQRPLDEPGDHVFLDEYGRALVDDHLADRFRQHLQAAGIDRAQLFEHNRRRRRIRLHDTRATFVTLALANGRTETWVADRTGHRSSAQIATYRRAARSVAEAGLGDLKSLSLAVPEVAGGSKGAAKGARTQAKLAELADALDSGACQQGPAAETSAETTRAESPSPAATRVAPIDRPAAPIQAAAEDDLAGAVADLHRRAQDALSKGNLGLARRLNAMATSLLEEAEPPPAARKVTPLRGR